MPTNPRYDSPDAPGYVERQIFQDICNATRTTHQSQQFLVLCKALAWMRNEMDTAGEETHDKMADEIRAQVFFELGRLSA